MSILNKHKTKQTSLRDYEWYKESGKFDDSQLKLIKSGFENGLTAKQVAIYADPDFDAQAMSDIECALNFNVDSWGIKLLIDTRFDSGQKDSITKGLVMNYKGEKLSKQEVLFIADPKFDEYQMDELVQGFLDGLSIDQVKSYADPELDWEQMRKMKNQILGIK